MKYTRNVQPAKSEDQSLTEFESSFVSIGKPKNDPNGSACVNKRFLYFEQMQESKISGMELLFI